MMVFFAGFDRSSGTGSPLFAYDLKPGQAAALALLLFVEEFLIMQFILIPAVPCRKYGNEDHDGNDGYHDDDQ